MTEEKKTVDTAVETPVEKTPAAPQPAEKSENADASTDDRRSRRRSGDRDRKSREPKTLRPGYEEVLLEVRRVTRVTTGGRRLAFRATILAGDRAGSIGIGVAKGPDVAVAVKKATQQAYKNLFTVPVTEGDTVPYSITHKFKSAVVRIMPASAGTGLKAGSSVRTVLELAGYQNILSKIIGTNNKLNNVIATLHALESFKHQDKFAKTPAQKDDKKEDKKEEKKSEKSEKTSEKKSEKTSEKSTKSPAKPAAKKSPKSSDEKSTEKSTKPAAKKTTKKSDETPAENS